ncbi:hypothetical protein NEMIN01_0322 [Nematocida minor]|uniref:uncharacterized protein n=1 Tax=Nematocida minor TaxID=1912983 RepID=UPI002220658B|nr:uncharacterized protein NEMIN01_0322 [Nematocida minor]KAI5189156.1 hypothetical protein NEMIN01_0322 [Nematocida minor]
MAIQNSTHNIEDIAEQTQTVYPSLDAAKDIAIEAEAEPAIVADIAYSHTVNDIVSEMPAEEAVKVSVEVSSNTAEDASTVINGFLSGSRINFSDSIESSEFPSLDKIQARLTSLVSEYRNLLSEEVKKQVTDIFNNYGDSVESLAIKCVENEEKQVVSEILIKFTSNIPEGIEVDSEGVLRLTSIVSAEAFRENIAKNVNNMLNEAAKLKGEIFDDAMNVFANIGEGSLNFLKKVANFAEAIPRIAMDGLNSPMNN